MCDQGVMQPVEAGSIWGGAALWGPCLRADDACLYEEVSARSVQLLSKLKLVLARPAPDVCLCLPADLPDAGAIGACKCSTIAAACPFDHPVLGLLRMPCVSAKALAMIAWCFLVRCIMALRRQVHNMQRH